ncbi:hypothetical protein KC329_g79 [Hortaea werneckii]|nr:hypothetical protein KC329_g79 [Hortaea werneckii]
MSCKSRPRTTAFPSTDTLRSPRSWPGLQFYDTRDCGSLPKPTSRLSRKTSAPKSDAMGLERSLKNSKLLRRESIQ